VARFHEWSPDDEPGGVIPVPEGWNEIRETYAPRLTNAPLERLIKLADQHEVRSVVVERRYIDIDYRSEHSRFYSTTFQRYPSVCHRLHFFRGDVPEALESIGAVNQADYMGYAVMRPIPNAPVGRTVMVPPPELDGGCVAIVEDEVHLWGQRFVARGVPFVSQDAQFMRCAHSALWMMLYHGHLAHGSPRRLPGDIQTAATGGNVLGRQVPSEGLSVGQVLAALHEFSLAGPRLKLPATKEKSQGNHRLSLPGVMARYVNSQMPPMVYSKDHAWVVVGHKGRSADGEALPEAVLFRHDDARGPYLRVEDPWAEPEAAHKIWKGAIPPLPQKMYMTSERAELVGERRLRRRLDRLSPDSALWNLYQGNFANLTVRTYGMKAIDYLAKLDGRYPAELDELAALYCLQHWSRWIWVVELVDRTRLNRGEPCVVGEAIIDGTASNLSSINDPVLIARRLWDEAVAYSPDYEVTRRYEVPTGRMDYLESGSEIVRGWSYPHA
jgi:hypothetical protein